jgi:type III secretion protein W
MADPRISGASPTSAQALQLLQKAAEEEQLIQIESSQDLEQWCDLDAFNPMAMMRRFRPLDEFKEVHHNEHLEEEARLQKEEKVAEIEKPDDAAARFQRDNDELQSKTLLILRSRLSSKDSPDDVLRKVLEAYPDPALADEAMEFLLQTSDPALGSIILLAREKLNIRFDAEIKAGKNMGAQAREFSKEGLGSPTSLRDMYRDITHNPRDPLNLFDELSDKFPYDKLRTVIKFLLHSLGSDLRSKGPSISRAELVRLIDETRSLQGILGIYRFFQLRMKLIERQFASYDVTFPNRLQFEALSKQLVKFLAERFMSPEKILQSARQLGISEEAIAQIIVFTQMREALKQISPRYFRNPKHRDELFQIFLKTLDELEGELAEEEEIDLENHKKKKKKDDGSL